MIETSRGVRQAFDKRFAAVGLNMSQALLISLIEDFGPHTQTQIADVLSLGKAGTGSMIDQLEARDLVKREPDPADRRVWIVTATPAGSAMMEHIREIDKVLQVELRSGISRSERQQLADLLMKIQTNLTPILNQASE